MLCLLLLLAAQLPLGGSIDKQVQFTGVGSATMFGFPIVEAGDLNGDGVPDFLVGEREHSSPPLDRAGAVWAVSGADCSLLFGLFGNVDLERFGTWIETAHLNADGVPDILVGSPDRETAPGVWEGRVSAFDGASLLALWHREGDESGADMGYRIATLGDLNGDGAEDLAVSAPWQDGFGRPDEGIVRVLSGADGSLLYEFTRPWFHNTGWELDSCDDVDGDGYRDLLVCHQAANEVDLYSGVDGTHLRSYLKPAGARGFGKDAKGVSDFDGDGIGDHLISGWHHIESHLFLFSGASGALLFDVPENGQGDLFATTIGELGDVDGDGLPELACYAKPNQASNGLTGTGAVHLYAGDGSSKGVLEGQIQGHGIGSSFCRLGDVDGDGYDEFIVRAGRSEFGDDDVAMRYGYRPYLRLDSDTISVSASQVVTASIDFPLLEAGRGYALLCSLAGTGPTLLQSVWVPLSSDWIFQNGLQGLAPGPVQSAYGYLDAYGDAQASFHADPGLSNFVGQTVYAAVLSYFPSSLTIRQSSAAAALVLVP